MLIYRTTLSAITIATTLGIASGETLQFDDLTARQKVQFNDMYTSYYYIGEVDWSIKKCAYEIPSQIELILEISKGTGNLGLSVTSPFIYCSARYFPTTEKSQCESTMENLAIASQLNRAFRKTEFAVNIAKKCN